MKLACLSLAPLLLAGPAAAQKSPVSGPVWDQIRLLRSSSADRREQAALALAGMAERAQPAARYLIEALDDPEVPVYVSAGYALVRIGPAALPAMQKALAEGNDTIRAEVSHILERMGRAGRPAVPALVAALDEGSATTRESVATALGSLLDGASGPVPEGTAEALVRLLSHESTPQLSHARAAAALSLGKLGAGAAAAVPALLQGLEDRDPRVRTACAWALGGGYFEPTPARWMRMRERRAGVLLAPESVVPALILALEDQDPAVCWASAQSLAGYAEAGRPAMTRLRALIGDVEPGADEAEGDTALLERFRLRRPAGESGMLRVPAHPSMVPRLMTIAFRAAPPRDASAPETPQDAPAPGVIRVPASPESVASATPPPLRPDLELHRSVVRLHAAAALWELGEESAPAAVVAVLRDDPNAAARELAAMFLGRMATPEAIPVLSAALEDDDPQVREAADLALRAIDRR
jgi:HEAT repeat protein